MSAQPQVLKLADKLEAMQRWPASDVICLEVATELRQLYEVNAELVRALQAMLGCCYDMERNDETIAAVKLAMKAIYSATGDLP
jgi:hypothetical protein